MRIVPVATALVATLALVSCEPVTEPATDPSFDPPAPSFAVLNPVIEQVTGSANFYWTAYSGAYEGWRTSSLSAHKYADGSVAGTYQAKVVGHVSWRARVECFTIWYNRAWLGLVVEESSDPNQVGGLRGIYVEDNGQGSAAEPDRATALVGLIRMGYETPEEFCQATPYLGPFLVKEVETGDLQVRENGQTVVEKVTGTAIFHRTIQSTGVTYLHRQTFAARRIADGSALGRLHGIGSSGPFGGAVHCFTVLGNEAWLGFYTAYGQERFAYVVDNGEGVGAPPDRSTSFPPLSALGDPPEGYDEWDLDLFCDETPEIPGRFVSDLEAGNVRIQP